MYISSEFFPKREIEKINDPEMKSRRVLISMTSPNTKGCKPAVLNDCWHAVLRLEVHDIDPNARSRRKNQTNLVYFDRAHAAQVIDFLKEHEADEEREIWVHCEAGISRSAAVAKFAAQIYSISFPEKYNLYNRHIFSTLLNTYYKSWYGDETDATTR